MLKHILVFNDNVLDANQKSIHNGAGSAAIRTYSCKYAPDAPPRAIGVPTGWSSSTGGFKVKDGELEPFASRAIVLQIERLILCIEKYANITTRVIFSCNAKHYNKIGNGVFELNTVLVNFISSKLLELPARICSNDSKFTLTRIDELEKQVAVVATLHDRIATIENKKRMFLPEQWESPAAKRAAVQDAQVMTHANFPRLLKCPKRLSSAEEIRQELHYIGITSKGFVLYEKIESRKHSIYFMPDYCSDKVKM